jgi:hypothetical protein
MIIATTPEPPFGVAEQVFQQISQQCLYEVICVGVCCLSGGMPGSSAGWDIRDHPGMHLLGQA